MTLEAPSRGVCRRLVALPGTAIHPRPMRRLLAPLILSLASCASAGGSAAASLAPIKVIPGYFGDARAPDGNTIVFEGKDGLVVVDTGRHLDHQEKILAYARERGKPIIALVNTHWHLDHSGGNAEIRAVHPNARIHTSNAVAGALEGFLAKSLERARERLADPKLPEEQKAEVRLGIAAMEDRRNLLPDVPITGPAALDAGGRTLKLHLADRAATEGDVWLYDAATRTAVVGDLVVLPAPFFDTGCAQGWREALAEIGRAPFTTLIPGHGPSMSRAQFVSYRKAFDRLADCAEGNAAAEACVSGWLGDAAEFLPTEQDRKGARQLLEYYLPEILRSPEKKAELCDPGR
jgi:glyoxylase-like metal-dependent hydrolase (beta-lactamase superfamily II)